MSHSATGCGQGSLASQVETQGSLALAPFKDLYTAFKRPFKGLLKAFERSLKGLSKAFQTKAFKRAFKGL